MLKKKNQLNKSSIFIVKNKRMEKNKNCKQIMNEEKNCAQRSREIFRCFTAEKRLLLFGRTRCGATIMVAKSL